MRFPNAITNSISTTLLLLWAGAGRRGCQALECDSGRTGSEHHFELEFSLAAGHSSDDVEYILEGDEVYSSGGVDQQIEACYPKDECVVFTVINAEEDEFLIKRDLVFIPFSQYTDYRPDFDTVTINLGTDDVCIPECPADRALFKLTTITKTDGADYDFRLVDDRGRVRLVCPLDDDGNCNQDMNFPDTYYECLRTNRDYRMLVGTKDDLPLTPALWTATFDGTEAFSITTIGADESENVPAFKSITFGDEGRFDLDDDEANLEIFAFDVSAEAGSGTDADVLDYTITEEDGTTVVGTGQIPSVESSKVLYSNQVVDADTCYKVDVATIAASGGGIPYQVIYDGVAYQGQGGSTLVGPCGTPGIRGGIAEAPPTPTPTAEPTAEPTVAPTEPPTVAPTVEATPEPTVAPTVAPTEPPTESPTESPTAVPTAVPTAAPTAMPVPTSEPTPGPPSKSPAPTKSPTMEPTPLPSPAPVPQPTLEPSTPSPVQPTTPAPVEPSTPSPVKPTAPAPTEDNGDAVTDRSIEDDDDVTNKELAGIIVGSILGCCLLCCFVVLFRPKKEEEEE